MDIGQETDLNMKKRTKEDATPKFRKFPRREVGKNERPTQAKIQTQFQTLKGQVRVAR